MFHLSLEDLILKAGAYHHMKDNETLNGSIVQEDGQINVFHILSFKQNLVLASLKACFDHNGTSDVTLSFYCLTQIKLVHVFAQNAYIKRSMNAFPEFT